MARAKTPLKTLLMLGLAVLLLHLVLLQAVPLQLASNSTPHTVAASFVTRTVAAQAPTNRTPSPAPIPQPRAKPKPRPMPGLAATPPGSPVAAPLTDTGTESGNAKPAPGLGVELGTDVELAMEADALDAAPQQLTSTPEATSTSTPAPAPVSASASASTPASAPSPSTPPRDKTPDFVVSGVPQAIKLIYQVDANKFPYSLNGELLWAPDAANQYVASLRFGAFGQSRVQTSRGAIGPQGLLPERFSDKFRNEVAAHFNRAQGKVTFSANTPDAALLQGAQDRLSVLIQLAAMVASAPERFTPATTLTIQTVGPRDADLWLFTVGTMETLTLPGGTVPALKLSRNPRQPYDQQVDIWLAPALGYLPARIRITDANGDAIDQQWRASEPATNP